ncbi:MAG: RNA methyltransferase [Betaproteobacteria bacterium]|nr:RNA methyltransferase [Betaproteobacteria bacterium]
MTTTISIESSQNAFFKTLKHLADSAQQRREKGQTLLDGEHLIEAYLAGGGIPIRLLVTDNQALMRWQTRCPQVPISVMAPQLLSALSPVKTPSGVMALIAVPMGIHLPAPHFSVLLEHIQDPGNLGAMLRSAAAAGVDTVYLSEGCADVWSPKVLRGGMGAHFSLHLVERADLIGIAARFSGTVYSTALDAPRNLYECNLTGNVAFAFGNEGAGLSSDLRAATHQAVRIPMPGRMESLNAAAALAICLFERVRQFGVGATQSPQ